MWAQHGRSISIAGGLWSENGYRATAPATHPLSLHHAAGGGSVRERVQGYLAHNNLLTTRRILPDSSNFQTPPTRVAVKVKGFRLKVFRHPQ